ncbi:hypothetical protein JCM10213v2_007479 [Rhodosporidiobolus nylandii]
MRTFFLPSLLGVVATAGLVSADRTFTVENNCGYTIWPAIFTSGGTAPSHPTGWEAKAGSSVSFSVAHSTLTLRLIGQPTIGMAACLRLYSSYDMLNRRLQRGARMRDIWRDWQWNLNDSQDWYDVSGVDGADLPLSITNNVGCPEPACTKDINTDCPAVLSVHNDEGDTVGCLSACAANLDGNQADSGNCCSGSHDTPATCPKESVQYYDVFKSACPDMYAYAYDEASGSALWTCDHSKQADYTLTFCPA